ncbi:hypothetical protein RB195_005206 [Necator americanus]|uniref:Uncharacterized protein n=2 Tax=Necator americanus TaxID=51031 RepID=A0ABR1BPY6_NECAM|nr:hypothetical protein NECAME_05439 [Necator americanus]ETN68850.1 hypothetical protein NECAME_05439 [Necator americanus]
MNIFPCKNQEQESHHNFCFISAPLPDTDLVPHSSSHYSYELDTNDLQAELLKEKTLRESLEKELQQQQKLAFDLSARVHYSCFMMFQMQEAYNRLKSCKENLMMENAQLKETVVKLERKNAQLIGQQKKSELAIQCVNEEENNEGFDVNEMYGTKNELLLMALNYNITSRQSPKEHGNNS